MLKETQPLPFEEIKQGSPESYISYRKLTPEAFRQIKGQLGKPIDVTFVNESWIYEGPGLGFPEEDYSAKETHVNGTLIKVDERTIEVEINSGETTCYSGVYIEPRGTHKEFPFYQKQFTLGEHAEISQIGWFTVEDQTFYLRWQRH